MKNSICVGLSMLTLTACSHSAGAQEYRPVPGSLEFRLLQEDAAGLAQAARSLGDAKRGAIAFHQPYMACTKCHSAGEQGKPLGPDMTKLGKEANDVYLVESILQPSKVVKKGFEPIVIVTVDGKSLTGLMVEDRADAVVIRDASRNGKLVTIAKSKIDEQAKSKVSIMPPGLVNQLVSRQQFLDLLKYLMEIVEHGPRRALELRPAPSLYAARPLPEYEKRIDHAGIIKTLNGDSLKRGAEIYNRLCINCHGTQDRPGSLPTSLRFASGKFKNGGDPFTMYQTLTRGFGMMVPQSWMVPEQKYDVIHYIRQEYLKPHNPSQLFPIDDNYLAGLPKGNTRGPKPSNIQPWIVMDYGPFLTHTYQVPGDALNFAYKGIAVRVDPGPGGVSRGRRWMIFDHDTMRMSAAWTGQGFIDWNGIMFNGRHNIHPKIVGQVNAANPVGPGWANPADGSFVDLRLKGRDGRLYGPLPREWAHYKGTYQHGHQVIVAYTVGNTDVLEKFGSRMVASQPVFTRTFNIGPRDKEMVLQVAHRPDLAGRKLQVLTVDQQSVVLLGATTRSTPQLPGKPTVAKSTMALNFNGATRIEVADADAFDLSGHDYTIAARINTRKDGTVFCKTAPRGPWVRDGKSLFIRGGKLTFDIGWVGAVRGTRSVNDGKWHDVAMSWNHKSGAVRLFVDGKLDGQGTLQPKSLVKGHVVRLGYTAANFPPNSYFNGKIAEVRYYTRVLADTEIAKFAKADVGGGTDDKSLLALWKLDGVQGDIVRNLRGKAHAGRIAQGVPAPAPSSAVASTRGILLSGIAPAVNGAKWTAADGGNLRLTIPAGEQPLRFTLWLAQAETTVKPESLAAALDTDGFDLDLATLTHGGPARWPDTLKTQAVIGKDDQAFAVDVLTRPATNPWLCRVRLTGFDFYPDGDRMAACTWDGDVWLITGLKSKELAWRRIASGLFQPLGLKIVDGKLYASCRDQIAILHDLNGDAEIDFIQNFNNDHQVTEHFHEFAMGLQTDAAGNFYYAKSARHALKAIVPHHGTLLRVSKDGLKTDIVANGFRAANGVCLNPDGTFIVTDQEGHWNPKNRINWVKEGGFYGNMFGYHDVTDSSDSAMQQPLCWITNAFDRSPAELLWVDSKKWGPLDGSLLNFSYGYGKVYVVPHETVDGQAQGGMCQLPLPNFPTGVMRGRFHPGSGQLYTCGMFAWAGSQHQPGGLYRIRYTGKPVYLPIGLHAKRTGMSITFSAPLDRASAEDVSRYAVKTWSLKRTASYGSKHYDEKPSEIASAKLSDDGRTVFLNIPDIKPTWCMELRYAIQGANGERVDGTIHNTIHNLGE